MLRLLMVKKEIVIYIWEIYKLPVGLRQAKMKFNSPKSKYDSTEQLKELFGFEVFFVK
jgi:hypothetical protein